MADDNKKEDPLAEYRLPHEGEPGYVETEFGYVPAGSPLDLLAGSGAMLNFGNDLDDFGGGAFTQADAQATLDMMADGKRHSLNGYKLRQLMAEEDTWYHNPLAFLESKLDHAKDLLKENCFVNTVVKYLEGKLTTDLGFEGQDGIKMKIAEILAERSDSIGLAYLIGHKPIAPDPNSTNKSNGE
jgi:hypothetical protein